MELPTPGWTISIHFFHKGQLRVEDLMFFRGTAKNKKTCLTFELQISRLSGTWTCSFCRCSCSQSDRPSQSSKNWWSVEESLDVWRRDIHLQNFWLVKWSEHCFWENPKLQNLSRALIGAYERVHTKHSSSRTAVWCLWVMQEHLQWSWDHTV